MQAYIKERLTEHLLELPDLANKQTDRGSEFADEVLVWLSNVEATLQRLRHPLTGKIASQRTAVYSARHAASRNPAAGGQTSGRQTEALAAGEALREIDEELRRVVNAAETRIIELTERMTQLLAVVSSVRPIPAPTGPPGQEWLRSLWLDLEPITETKGLHAYLSAAAAPSDLNYVLESVLSNLLHWRC